VWLLVANQFPAELDDVKRAPDAGQVRAEPVKGAQDIHPVQPQGRAATFHQLRTKMRARLERSREAPLALTGPRRKGGELSVSPAEERHQAVGIAVVHGTKDERFIGPAFHSAFGSDSSKSGEALFQPHQTLAKSGAERPVLHNLSTEPDGASGFRRQDPGGRRIDHAEAQLSF
jgi:hypothetical protein